MTARDTHELRLDLWPRLSTFPTTNALVATVILLAIGTYAAWVCGRTVPDGWYLFVAGLSGIATTHFGVKRKTDFRNGATNGGDGAAH